MKHRFFSKTLILSLLLALIFGGLSVYPAQAIKGTPIGNFASALDDFVITVKTDNPGTSTSTQFTIPTTGTGYNYNVDCDNDGVNEATAQTGNYTCSYATAGTYTIRIKDNSGALTGFPRIYFNNGGDSQKLLTIVQWGKGKWTSMASAFFGCANMTMTATDAPDLSGVTNMSNMFRDASVFNGNIGNWNTGNVTNMGSLFNGAKDFNQDIGVWDTANVTDMSNMFQASDFNQDIGDWDTANVTTMSNMFHVNHAFNQDISGWNTSKVTNMNGMFRYAAAFEQNLGSWDVTAVTDATSMFYGMTLSTTNYDALLQGWDAQILHSAVPFDGGNSRYCLGETARAHMISSDGWTISDGGKDCPIVTFNSNGGGAPSPASQSVAFGSPYGTLATVSRTGYTFNGWFTSASGGSLITSDSIVSTASDHTLYAQWSINSYTLTYTAGEHGSITGTSPQTVSHGASGTAVTAVPDTGYHFVQWSDASTANPRTDTNVTGNITVTATFAQDEYTLTVNSAHGTVTKTPDQATYHYGDVVTLSVTPDTGWTFKDWTPSLTNNQVTISGNTTVTANYRQISVITWVDPADIVYGTSLSATQLNATANVPGTFTYTPAAGTYLPAGTHTLHVDFTPLDNANYTNDSKDVSLTVTQATPTITWANPVDIVYGTALSSTQLNATANVPGIFTYMPASGTVLSAGTHTLHVDFTPTDTANYANVSKDVSIIVTSSASLITWSNPANIVYGTALSSAQLNASASVPGAFTYTPADGTILNAGTHTLHVDFIPTDLVNYDPASRDVTLIVTQAAPVLTWADPADISYGTALGATQLNATASIPGTFTYTPVSGSFLTTGVHTLHVDFVPADAVNYTNASKEVSITVTQAAPILTWVNPANISYGTPLSATQLNATADVPGTFTYTPAAGTYLPAGTHTLHVDFVPTDTASYANTSKDVSITVLAGTIFTDVPIGYWAKDSIERLYFAGVTGGCSTNPLMYCPIVTVTRDQMAVFLLRGEHGFAYTPPPATGTMFADVPSTHWAAAWIEQLANEGITSGCRTGYYCPGLAVTRDQVAIFLLRTKYGSSYTPPAATGTMFADVPPTHWAAAWIEQLANEGITGGCGNGNYCPTLAVTRDQMAVFLVRAFNLP